MTRLDKCTEEEIDAIVKSEKFDTAIKILESSDVEICLKNGVGVQGLLGDVREDVIIVDNGGALTFIRISEVAMIAAPEWFEDHPEEHELVENNVDVV